MRNCILISAIIVWCCGCGGPKVVERGFLTDYSQLEKQSNSRFAMSSNKLGSYDKFIVAPVQVHFHSGIQAIEERTAGKMTEQEIIDLQKYMHNAVVNALSSRYQIVTRPGPGVARLKVALTDFERSKALLNVMPTAKLTGVGLGSATMEAEILDSQTAEQLRALVEMQKGNRLSLDGLTKWGDAKAVMDKWAISLRKRIDEAHGYR